MSHVSSDPETEEQPDLFRVRRKDPAKCGTIVQKVWPSRKNRRGILVRTAVGNSIIFRKAEVYFHTERCGGSLWYGSNITGVGNTEISTQKP